MKNLLIIALAVAGAVTARADGGFLPFPGHEIWEPGQTALIAYDEASGAESLSILPRFSGEPADFAWIVPVPALPQVTAAEPALFAELAALTAPPARTRDEFWQCSRQFVEPLAGGDQDDGDVEVVDERVVGIYRTTIIDATDAAALFDSLATWGYLHDSNRAAVTPVLQDYVDDGWYFVAMAVDSAAVADAGWPYGKAAAAAPGAPYWYYPALQPVTFAFTSPTCVYPLRISRLSTQLENAVSLYVATEHRVEFPGCSTSYANRLTAAERAALAERYPRAAAAVGDRRFLTRLYRSYTGDDLDADLVLTPAAADTEYLPVRYSGLPFGWLAFGGSALGWAGWRWRRWRRGRRYRSAAARGAA
jgi:hypothetical protein